ncbi:rab3 GTPase-activating protein catalytic subunit [Impatiens glandulifera]|uniref:rab3 GTPase-activating protein catalytic subunit n=1 Tax=Impatiens glandulifera TaxID=253017 RepID=UPI001FB0EC75|nr:rab3 GTPase-activating protein catalytic subunit [Impatiens glandulifera]
MDSSTKMKVVEEKEDDDQTEEFEHFDDFTLASSWERFISEIEAVCRQWLADGPKNLLHKGAVSFNSSKSLYAVKSELKYAAKSYSLEYYFEPHNNGNSEDWSCHMHDQQLSFGVKDFLVVTPQSASGVVLDAPEASKLLSAVAIALSNCSSLWPAFVPVHDPSRKAYIGIQNMGTVFTRRFEGDHISSQVPLKLMHLEGLYELFVSKFAYSTLDLSMHLFKVHFTMKSTYRTFPYGDDDEIPETDLDITNTQNGAGTRGRTQWDDDCPWSEWYTTEDPITGINLIAIWSERTVDSSLEMAEMENASPHDAGMWFIFPDFSESFTDGSVGNLIGFASQLRLLVNALDMSFEAQFMEDFVSAENSGSDNLKSSAIIPPPTVLDRVLKDIFHGVVAPSTDSTANEHKHSRTIKGAPLQSLFAQFCLHALWFGSCNIRAIAVLWIEFVREVRWCWEEIQQLPRMPTNGVIDLSTCLINQKLHMLAVCIHMKRQLHQDGERHDYFSAEEEEFNMMNEVSETVTNEEESLNSCSGDSKASLFSSKHEAEDTVNSNISSFSSHSRRGSADVSDMMLLNSNKRMHVPLTQDPPLMTEDMHEERIQAVEALGDSFSFSAQLEKDILSSDMSAFKAANPDAVFEDFIRWHSPKDWESEENDNLGKSLQDVKTRWPPRGRLSERMSDHGNSWRKIWNEAYPFPASEQKPLMDPSREAEKILHYFETLPPHQLLEQMVCTAFRASADTLNLSSFGNLKQMTTKIGQLYPTMASTLRPLQANRLSGKSETIEDIRRLCSVFEHIEKLLTVAASIHRKFLQAPRLEEAIFTDYFNFYLPNLGTGLVEDNLDQELIKKQQRVRMQERGVISNMFTQPTANQSWRKVLSMGNLLNGHEPVQREIVFALRDKVSGSYYAARSPNELQEEEIETYRMYISGTSNDLHVALSVASCD